jgi:Icc-related predicted phosphoesterase
MKLLAFTDFHGDQDAFRKARQTITDEKPDLVLVAGDIVNHDGESARRLLTSLADTGAPIYFVPGNMDSIDLVNWAGEGSVRGLHGRCEYLGGIGLLGLGGSPRGAFATPIEYTEQVAAEILDGALKSFHGGSLILVSHCPPRDSEVDQVSTGRHIGSVAVRQFVERIQPMLVVSGHVHEAKGEGKIGPTVLLNPGPARSGNYARVNIDNSVVKLSLAKFK